MANDNQYTETVVRLSRRYRAPRARVFEALTQAALLAEWFARGPGTPPGNIVALDVRPGGRYVIEVIGTKDGLTYRMQGTYREVVPPERISFTWWYDRADFAESLVTIELRALDDLTTELTLTHTLLPERALDGHRQGWEECLTNLAGVLAPTSATT
jgi:uncharacterized protein YndB with AHSA1/START domain